MQKVRDKMTREEAIRWLISVKEEVDEYEVTMIYVSDKEADALGMAIESLSERTGEWIFEETDEYKRTYCSVCGAAAPFVCVSEDLYGRRLHGRVRKTKFCPNCGADMRR